jgi:hypothetical protein
MLWLKRTVIALAVVGGIAGYLGWKHPRGGKPADRVVWARDPLQTDPDLDPFEVTTKEGPVRVVPRAGYALDGVLVSHRENLDAFSYLIPIDACFVWGLYADAKERSDVSFANHGRVCYFEWHSDVDGNYLKTHLSNNHLVPANDNLRRAIFWMGDGDEVRLEGYLVDLEIPVPRDRIGEVARQLANGDLGNVEQKSETFTWRTSMSRNDEGMGACETIWVTAVQIGKKRYQ